MNHNNFIRVKQLSGELVMSHNRNMLETSVTTKEVFFQKPDHTYHILFDDILSIIPIDLKKEQTTLKIADELKVKSTFSNRLYKIATSEMLVMNRSGRHIRQGTELIIPLSDAFLEKISQFSGLTLLPTK